MQPDVLLGGEIENKKKKVKKEKLVTKIEQKDEFEDENQGDHDLESYLKNTMSVHKNIKDTDMLEGNNYQLLKGLGVLNVFGTKLWKYSYNKDWTVRKSAAEACLEYLKNPILKRHMKDPKKLFRAACEIARHFCTDSVNIINIMGLKILNLCFQDSICSEKLDSKFITEQINISVALIMKNISGFQKDLKELSIDTVADLFRLKQANFEDLIVENILDICDKDKDILKYNKYADPIYVQPKNTVLGRIRILQELFKRHKDNKEYFGDKVEQYQWTFELLVLPALRHNDREIRDLAFEMSFLYLQFLGDRVRLAIENYEGLNPHLQKEFERRADIVEEDVVKKIAEEEGLEEELEIQEDD